MRAAVVVGGLVLAGLAADARAQSIQSYRCRDGTRFILAFYPQDRRAFLQLDGGEMILGPRPSVTGSRYAGRGVTLVIPRNGDVSIRHLKRPATTCELA